MKARRYRAPGATASAIEAPLGLSIARPFGSNGLGALRLGLFAAVTLLMAPAQMAALRVLPSISAYLPRLYHRIIGRIMGLRVERIGTISDRRPTLFVSNHASYFDIVVLGSLLDTSFVAKADVADWPFFGTLARLQRTLFVDRRPASAHKQRDDLRARLLNGDNLVLFPEGTSSDGNRVLPFRSALMSAAFALGEEEKIAVQPVSLVYTTVNGMPLGRDLRPFVAWYGGMELAPHLWQFAGLGRVGVRVEFHAPVSPSQFRSRKELAQHCFEETAKGHARALSLGRADRWVNLNLPNINNMLKEGNQAGENDYTQSPTA